MAKTGATRVFEEGAWVALFALTYFGFGILGIVFYFDPEHVATFWPASGVFLAGLLLSRFGLWPVLVLAAIGAHVAFDVLVSGKAVGTSLFFTSADVVEACTGAFLLRRVLGMSGTLSQLKEVLGLAVLAGMCATALGAVVGAAAVVTMFPKAVYWFVWQVWGLPMPCGAGGCPGDPHLGWCDAATASNVEPAADVRRSVHSSSPCSWWLSWCLALPRLQHG